MGNKRIQFNPRQLKGGYACPLCRIPFHSDQCRHSWNDIEDYNREQYTRSIVRDELQKLQLKGPR